MSVVVEVVEALLVTEERRCGFRRKRKTRETDRQRELFCLIESIEFYAHVIDR